MCLKMFILIATCSISVTFANITETGRAATKLENEYKKIIRPLEKGVICDTTQVFLEVSAGNMTYFLYTKEHPDQDYRVKYTNISELNKPPFCRTKKTVFVIPGWINLHTSPMPITIRKALLKRNDINIFVVDWSPISMQDYVTSRCAVGRVAKYVAQFIQSLVSKRYIKMSEIMIIGHSLGAQLSGYVGAVLRGKVGSILGLDPARPFFTLETNSERLDKTDAKFVQIMHTNDMLLGSDCQCGHADYYPNGGEKQPGCFPDVAGTCAHARAYYYYAESVFSAKNQFISVKCKDYSHFKKCKKNSRSPMGGYPLDKRAYGKYYLDTNRKPPYAKGAP